MKIIVHPKPDLDACACIALAGARPQDVHFLPAGAPTIPSVCPCCGDRLTGRERVLDHPLGEKGRLDADGTRHAAAASMPEAVGAHPDLIAEVEEQDSTGRVLHPRFSLADIASAIRKEASERGYRDVDLDREVIATMGRIIRGINLIHITKQTARELLVGVRIEKIADFRVAILPRGTVSPQVGFVLNEEHDVAVAIYHETYNLGVNRYPGHDTPDLRKLASYLPGWFVHTAGFLACWGSRKSPETAPPPKDTPQNQEELLALLRKEFGGGE